VHYFELVLPGKEKLLFYEQFLNLCEKNGIKPTALLVQLGMSKGSLSNWKSGKLPSGDALVRFSEHFGVSLDYLIYGSDRNSRVSKEDQEWLTLIHRLPEDAQLEFKGELKGYLKCLNRDISETPGLREAK